MFLLSERRPLMAAPIDRRRAGRIHRFFLGRRVLTAPANLTPFWAGVEVVMRVIRRVVLADRRLIVRLSMTITAVVVAAVVVGSVVYVVGAQVLLWGWAHR